MSTEGRCPFCGLELTHDTVDNGVGEERCGPDGCDWCCASYLEPASPEYAAAVTRGEWTHPKHPGWVASFPPPPWTWPK